MSGFENIYLKLVVIFVDNTESRGHHNSEMKARMKNQGI